MIRRELLDPKSIVVVGGSNDIHKPGGKVLKNLLDGGYKGEVFVLNPKEDSVQGIKSYRSIDDLPDVELAIIAIAAKYTPDSVRELAYKKNTRAFIILSAGFSEESEEGAKLEKEIVRIVNDVNGSLIGPNCVGVLTPNYHGVFTEPIPELDPKGCDFISGSGATACFIMESGIPKGLRFANVFSVGNSAQMGVEDILKYMDENFNPDRDSKVKLLYMEQIDKPELLLKHAKSLINKGCKIAAIKAGASEAGSRAASSHTGALASSDIAVDALFKKAGIVRCFGREDLISVASVFQFKEPEGKNFAIITHAGGPAVMLTDALEKGGFKVPRISGPDAEKLKLELFPGSSVSNPIDFLATGTAEQLGKIIDTVETKFDNIDAMAVIFGTPGLFEIFDVYDVLHKKMQNSKKPIFPVLPSILTAKKEVEYFVSKGNVFFSDEVVLAGALTRVYNTYKPCKNTNLDFEMDKDTIRDIIETSKNGYLSPVKIQNILDAAGIPRVKEFVVDNENDLEKAIDELGFPLVMKVVGPVHKSDVNGVVLNISSKGEALMEMNRLLKIKYATAVLLQPMLSGLELFAGVKREEKFGHLVLFGLGGIFIEVLKDVRTVLAPVSNKEVVRELKKLKSYKLLEGVRGKDGVDVDKLAEVISRLSVLTEVAPEIYELDLNPILGTKNSIVAVDARIRIEK